MRLRRETPKLLGSNEEFYTTSASLESRQIFTRHPRRNSFHEKAGRSQDGFVFTGVDLLPLSRAASVAILPSAVFSERLSLAARWASSIQ